MNVKKIRQELFNELSVNLSFYKENKSGKEFECPICLSVFNSTDTLSIAHLIPQSLGGSSFTLVCKKCNNFVGSNIESYEKNRAKFYHAFSGHGDSYWKCNLSPLDNQHFSGLGKVTAEIKLKEDEQRPTLEINILDKASSPKALQELKKFHQKQGSTTLVETQVRGGWNRSKLTYLHAAYLFLFSQLGYEWVFNECTQIIRDQILKPEMELLPFAPIQLNEFELINRINHQDQISWYLIVEPIESVGFMVVFSRLESFNSPIGVWMPLPGRSYNQMPKVFQFKVKHLPKYQKHLSSPESIYLGIKIFLQHFFD